MAIADFENEKRTTNFTGERYSVKICIYLGFWRKPGKSADFGGCRGRHFPPSLREKFANFSPYWREKKPFFFAPRTPIGVFFRVWTPIMRPGTLGGAGGDSGVSGAASGGGAASAAEALRIWQPELRRYVNRGHDLLLSLIFHATTKVKKMQVK